MKKSILLISLFLFLLMIVSCKKADDESANDTEKVNTIEKSIAFTASVLNTVGSTIMNVSPDDPGSFSNNSVQSDSFNYDSSTGWWTLQTTLSTGESATIKIQFIDSNGNFRKFFTYLIVKIKSEGTITGTNGNLTYLMDITNLQDGNPEVIFNGSGSVTYMGVTSTYTLNNIIASGYNDYAQSGTLSVMIDGVTVSVNYNGTSKITVSFSYNGNNYTFTIDLETGTVS